jgi:hypothetical protein
MERLGALISKHVADGSWSPMQITKDGTRISHLFFADDVLLFAKANESQARIVNEVLERFCAMSGLKISLEKSKFCTSAGVSRRRREDIAVVTQIHATDKFEKYLGFKMFYGKVRKQDFSNVYDRVSAKLASWKSRLLNKAGRLILANSVLSPLPSYHMQINWLPQGMCDDLDRTVRRFIWKGTGDTGMHLVGWEKITQPRRFGGLGVRIARLQNVSLLGKLIWEVSNSPGKLWVKLFTDKYTKGRHLFNVSVSGGSCIWNSLAKALHMMRDGFTFKIGDGNSRFWYDPLALKENLCSTVPFVAIQDTELKINDVGFNGRWNLEKLYTVYLRVQTLYASGKRVGWNIFSLHLLTWICFVCVETSVSPAAVLFLLLCGLSGAREMTLYSTTLKQLCITWLRKSILCFLSALLLLRITLLGPVGILNSGW